MMQTVLMAFLAGLPLLVSAGELSDRAVALQLDDVCSGAGNVSHGDCALSALQVRGELQDLADAEEQGLAHESGNATGCSDKRSDCSGWAKRGECKKNPRYMLDKCKRSCGGCGGTTSGCLCIFDVDCTLSSRPDGHIELSDLGRNVRSTFCGGCAIGVITAASHPRAGLPHGLRDVATGCRGSCKMREARRMATRHRIKPSNVYFYDDKASNINPFHGSGMNARQVACGGKCGGTAGEVKKQHGVMTCR
eukprot:TRINITY_DN108210_c0_g1_i1.p1 TRINITY_DN108210_c0_g1~~TRINITY_DN108210_c0_g1_i1.p1  ORF type:complete len:250 (-),score=44.51 TRINITY_DN108210_c0_g1_i1:35-784(-)